jgi:hypothetical protein
MFTAELGDRLVGYASLIGAGILIGLQLTGAL